MICRRCIVTGRVQGVGFRFFTEREARALGIRGWVRNLDDGSVEICASGSAETMERFLESIRRGPSASRVEGVSVGQAELEEWSGFSIRG